MRTAHSVNTASKGKTLQLQEIPWKHEGTALLLPVSGFPIPEPELARIREFLQGLSDRVIAKSRLSLEIFVQLAQLSLADGARRFSAHAPNWQPEMGLGVWPDREPPSLWAKEDFLNLGPGEKPRRVTYHVFRVTALPSRAEARDVMFGLGTVIQIMTRDDSPSLLRAAREVLLPMIKEPAFRSFSYYAPLLDRNSLTAATAQQVQAWFCGSSLYIRESFEDTAILIASLQPLDTVLSEMGGQPSGDSAGNWLFES